MTFDNLLLLIVVGYSFLFGGTLQFFLGLSNTFTIFLLTNLLLLVYLINSYRAGTIAINKFTFFSAVALVYLITSSIINSTNLIRVLPYSTIIFLPLALYLTFRKRNAIQNNILKKGLLAVAIIQGPIILLQRTFYDFFINFNNSGQNVAFVDFGFGTFILKNDHSLGFFLIANLLYTSISPDFKVRPFIKLIIFTFLAVTILMLNSRISVLLLAFTVLFIFYKKSGFLRVHQSLKVGRRYWFAFLVTFSLILVIVIKPKPYYFFKTRIETALDYEKAVKDFEVGAVQRGQTVNIWLHEKINWVGNGPYSFFSIDEGGFSGGNQNFSHWLWVYNDLGLIGLIVFCLLFFMMTRTTNKEPYTGYLSFLLSIYGVFAIIMFDISFLLTYFIFKQKG